MLGNNPHWVLFPAFWPPTDDRQILNFMSVRPILSRSSSTILQDATRLSGVALGETRALSPFIFKGFWGSPHPSRFISHRSNSSCFPAFPSLFGPYSPFLPALVRTSSDWVNLFSINGSSRKGRFRGLWEHALCPGS